MLIRLRNKQQGIGLLELMLSLAIIALILIMATRYFTETSRSQKVNAGIQQIEGIIAAASKWKAGQTNPVYTGISIQDLVTDGFIPAAYLSGTAPNQTVNTAWSGVTVSSVSAGTEPTQFTVTLSGFSSSQLPDCNQLATAIQSLTSTPTQKATCTAGSGVTFTFGS